MKCPHCLESFFHESHREPLHWPDADSWADERKTFGVLGTRVTRCPSCLGLVVWLQWFNPQNPNNILREQMVWPRIVARAPLPTEVPEDFAGDYREACAVFSDSPKASAALSRRCLQHLLREKAATQEKDLSKQIDEVLGSKTLPSDLADAIDAIRNIGNFAAHPLKSTATDTIVDVELGEAEWLLDVLESLFDFYFVRPAALATKRDALNKKLQEFGKLPMK